MKFTLAEIQKMKEPLARLIEEKIPMTAAFRLTKLVKAFEAELILIEEQRVKLVKELGTVVEGDSEAFGVPPERVPEFQQRFMELLKEEVDLTFEGLKLSVFEGTSISAADMYSLEKLFLE